MLSATFAPAAGAREPRNPVARAAAAAKKAEAAAATAAPQPASDCVIADAATIAAWFDEWNLALASLDPEQVTQRYWPDAVLLPTVSNIPRTETAAIRDYFEHFLQKRPRGRILTRSIKAACNVSIDMGTYSFSLMDEKGRSTEVIARYSYVYELRDGAWKILHHHSSAMPEPLEVPRYAQQPKPKSAPAPAPIAKVEAPSRVGGSRPFLNLEGSPSLDKFYPAAAREKREQGSVALQVCTTAEGTTKGRPDVIGTSGSAQLDEAARDWAQAARWIPATHDNKPAEGCTQVSVQFIAPASPKAAPGGSPAH